MASRNGFKQHSQPPNEKRNKNILLCFYFRLVSGSESGAERGRDREMGEGPFFYLFLLVLSSTYCDRILE